MKAIPATIMRGGRVTIPKEVRDHLGINERGEILFVIEDDGTVELLALYHRSVASLAGAAGSLDRPLSWSEMRHIARDDRLPERDSTRQ